jgi:hypothetical protein
MTIIADARRIFIYILLATSGSALAITETLSVFGAVTPVAILLGWLLVLAAAIAWLRTRHIQIQLRWPRPSVFQWLFIASTGLLLTMIALSAWFSAPNTWDSMTYHLPRVEHWLQNGSVEHYFTNIPRQNYQHPLAEFVILHLRALLATDRLDAFVQFISLLGSMAAASLIARNLGANAWGQIFAVVFTASIPMSILQGSSTQNDMVTAFFCCVFVERVAAYSRQQSLLDTANILVLGLSLGLAVATKATTYIYLLPFALWLALLAIRRSGFRVFPRGLAIGVLALACVAPHFARNLSLYGTIFGSEDSLYRNETMTPALLVSNVLRNVHLHVVFPSDMPTPARFNEPNLRIRDIVQDIHDRIGIDIRDPRTTFTPQFNYVPMVWTFHEDTTAAPLHLLAVVLSLPMLIAVRRARTTTNWMYLLCVVGGFIVFCALLKYQVWHNRLHLPMFVLIGPLVATALTGIQTRAWSVLVGLGFAGLLAAGLAIAPRNQLRPLDGPASVLQAPRWETTFIYRPEIRDHYESVIGAFAALRCDVAGIWIGGDTWEQPFFTRARELGLTARFEHVSAQAENIRLTEPPCAIISEFGNRPITVMGQTYTLSGAEAPLSLLVPADPQSGGN